jgi:hypothetical protein
MTPRKISERARLESLREAIADAIATEKSYNVPALCVRLGLLAQAGEEDKAEAFRSKRAYVRRCCVISTRRICSGWHNLPWTR